MPRSRLAEYGKVAGQGKVAVIPISWPPPTRMPFTRQITGLSQPRTALTMSLNKRIMYRRYSPGAPQINLGILASIAAGAEGLRARAREYDSNRGAIIAGFA